MEIIYCKCRGISLNFMRTSRDFVGSDFMGILQRYKGGYTHCDPMFDIMFGFPLWKAMDFPPSVQSPKCIVYTTAGLHWWHISCPLFIYIYQITVYIRIFRIFLYFYTLHGYLYSPFSTLCMYKTCIYHAIEFGYMWMVPERQHAARCWKHTCKSQCQAGKGCIFQVVVASGNQFKW